MTKINFSTVFSQWDLRWANDILGFNSDPKYNFYNYACLLCSIASMCKYFSKDTDPISLNSKLKDVKGFAPGGGLYNWGSINKVFPNITESKTDTPDLLTDGQVGEIKSSLDSGLVVGIELDYNPRTVENDMHFVLIVDYNPSDENDFTIADPLGGKTHSLKDYLGWFKPSARKTIARYIIWTGPKPKIDSNSVVLSKDDATRRTHGNEQWIKLLGYLGITTDPALTLFEDAQKVIGGFKSRTTDLETQLATAKIDLSTAITEVANQKDKLANIEADCQNQLKLKDAEIKALSGTSSAIDKVKGEYQATINDLGGKLREVQKANGEKNLEITDLTTRLENCQKGIIVENPLVTFIKSIFEKLRR